MRNEKDYTQHLFGLTLVLLGVTSLITLTSYSWSRPAPSDLSNDLNSSHQVGQTAPGVVTQTRVGEAYGKLPLSFEANQGQADPQVKFLSRGKGYCLFLTPTEAVLTLRKDEKKTLHSSFSTLRMKLVGANPAPQVVGRDRLPGKSNYLIGNDPANWRTDVPHYAKVQYEEVYPGVDLVYYGKQQQLEYDFVLAAGADPKAIRLEFTGADTLSVNGEGDLVLQVAGGQVQMHKPMIYQEVEGGRQEIDGGYVLKGRQEVGFQVAAYDAEKPLIIDPILAYSTYLGGSAFDTSIGLALGGDGSVYVTGQTISTDFPITPGAFQKRLAGPFFPDAFVTKLDAAGTALLYSTYLGGGSNDAGVDIAVDADGNAYVKGVTSSTNFLTVNALQPSYGGGDLDAFVAKLDATGSALVFSTYLGGSGTDNGRGIAMDGEGNAHLVGYTDSTDFPTANPLQPANAGGFEVYAAKMNADGSALVYSTYLGGSFNDFGLGIAADADGNTYVAGGGSSADFPTTPAAFQTTYAGGRDNFVAKLNADGSELVYSTYLGGSGLDAGAFITVDADANAYVVGGTTSTDHPITPDAFQPTLAGGFDAVVMKLDAAGSALLYSTYLGGSNDDLIVHIAVDADRNIYVNGNTASPDFPTANALQPEYGGGSSDCFVTKLRADGSELAYSTYLGGSGGDTPNGIVVDSAGSVYVSGQTSSRNFPTTAGAFQTTYGGGSADGFIAKIADEEHSGRPVPVE